jgi:UDP-2,3-diacylglucosamine hydrolase
MNASSDQPLAIIAGGGSVPLHVATSAAAAGRKVLILGIEGEADQGIAAFPHEWFAWGQIGRLERLLAGHGTREIVMVGGVKTRPDFKRLKVDFGTMRALPEIMALMTHGDNSLLTGVIKMLERRGYSVVGAHEVATDLVASRGIVGAKEPGPDDLSDAEIAMAAAREIGLLDAGQAAVVSEGKALALEGADGTDAMLERVAAQRRDEPASGRPRAGVLAKCAKPQQDLRVDMPTIGPATVVGAEAAGLAGIAIEAGRVMIVDRAETRRRADAAGLFILAANPEEVGA